MIDLLLATPPPVVRQVQWPTCRVTYSAKGLNYNDSIALRRAVRKVKRVTGLKLVKRNRGQIRIRYRYISKRYLGWTSWRNYGWDITRSRITINRRLKYYGSIRTRKHLYMHELAHAVGVAGHVSNPNSVMYYSIRGVTKWTSQDRRVLRKAVPRKCRR